jgi:hypothetical protein
LTSPSRLPKDLLIYLRTLAAQAGLEQFIELRWLTPRGSMEQRFFAADAATGAARRIIVMAAKTDVYVGVALRDRPTDGGKDAISGSRLLYIECDDPSAQRRLSRFAHPPTMEIASGAPGHLHLYWRLARRATGPQVESANRRLALVLGGDLGCIDIARILRPPDTLNHKQDPPRPVRLLAFRSAARYTLAELTSGLPADPSPAATRRALPAPRRSGRTPLDHALLAVPAAEYVRVLAHREPNRAGKVLCPFHAESRPSLQLYPDGTFYCFGNRCRLGGTIFDFAAALWGLGTRGEDFLELRRRLAAEFHITRPNGGPR